MTAAEEGRENLSRQRRFLLVMCVIVIAYYALGAQVRPEVAYSGFLVTVERPELTTYGLWAIWTWALVGYCQRLYKLFAIVWQSILADVETEDRRLALRAAWRFAVREAAAGRINENYSQIVIPRRSIRIEESYHERQNSTGEVEKVPETDHYGTQSGGRKYRRLGGSLYGISKKGGGEGSSTFGFTMEWSKWDTRVHVWRAWTAALIRRPAITEHLLPLLVAVFTIGAPFYPWPTAELPPVTGLSGQRLDETR